jgi:hydroxymethylpyrimidine/phosphomethylpyrimidine kinase
VLAGKPGSRRELAERIHALGPAAVIVTGGHGAEPVDHLFDGREHFEIPVQRHSKLSTHGAGCTHSATLTALLAKGMPLPEAAEEAARIASRAVANGLEWLGAGEGPVDVLGLEEQG